MEPLLCSGLNHKMSSRFHGYLPRLITSFAGMEEAGAGRYLWSVCLPRHFALCSCASAPVPKIAAILQAFWAHYYLWCFDWLKLPCWLTAHTPLSCLSPLFSVSGACSLSQVHVLCLKYMFSVSGTWSSFPSLRMLPEPTCLRRVQPILSTRMSRSVCSASFPKPKLSASWSTRPRGPTPGTR